MNLLVDKFVNTCGLFTIIFFLFSESSGENLAWASAQIHCQCSINEKLILAEKIKKDSKPVAVNTGMFNLYLLLEKFICLCFLFLLFLIKIDTTFAPSSSDNGHPVLNTKPKILFCDLKLIPGESKSCKSIVLFILY